MAGINMLTLRVFHVKLHVKEGIEEILVLWRYSTFSLVANTLSRCNLNHCTSATRCDRNNL